MGTTQAVGAANRFAGRNRMLLLLGIAIVAIVAVMLPQSAVGAARLGPGIAAASDSCLKCHQVDPLFSHPIDVIPKVGMRSNLPLREGRMTCMTCHYEPGPDHAIQGRARATGDALLRTGAASELLCMECHIADSTSKHGAGIGKAHLAWPGRKPAAIINELDTESQNCLTCHDGATASAVSTRPTPGAGVFGNSHPVGVNYSRGPAQTVAAQVRDSRIRLFEGTVGCGSCHSPYSRQPGQLVMSNFKSALCLSCHPG